MKLFFVKCVLKLFSLLHPRHADIVSKPLAFLIWHISRRLRNVSLRNLELCYPQMPATERRQLAKQGIYHYARNTMEMGMMCYWPLERLNKLYDPIEDEHVVTDAKSRGNGIIVLVPHFGSWELFSLRMSQDYHPAILYKPGEHPYIEAILFEMRKRSGATPVPTNRRGLKEIFRFLAERRTVGILPDQEPKRGEGRFAPFFGVPALTGVFVPRLARRTGAAVLFGFCVRGPGGRYRIHFHAAEEDLYSEDLDTALAALNRGVEKCIALDPAQYLWAYKRFRARPEGEERFY